MCNIYPLKKYTYAIQRRVEGHQRKFASNFLFYEAALNLLSLIYEGLIKTNNEIKV